MDENILPEECHLIKVLSLLHLFETKNEHKHLLGAKT